MDISDMMEYMTTPSLYTPDSAAGERTGCTTLNCQVSLISFYLSLSVSLFLPLFLSDLCTCPGAAT